MVINPTGMNDLLMPPRRARLSAIGHAYRYTVAGIAIIAIALLYYVRYAQDQETSNFLHLGKLSVATVVDKVETFSGHGRSSFIKVRFSDNDQPDIVVTDDWFNAIHIGEQLAVTRLIQGGTKKYRVGRVTQSDLHQSNLSKVCGGLFVLFWLSTVVMNESWLNKRVTLLRNGLQMTGSICTLSASYSKYGIRYRYSFHFEVDKVWYFGTEARYAPELHEGDHVDILYLPVNPCVNLPIRIFLKNSPVVLDKRSTRN